jgi:hypothetical protein
MEGGMSDTPRTDNEEMRQTQRFGVHMVKSEFSRQLERELTAAQIGAARYEYLRKLRPSDAAKLWKDCAFQGLNFDAEVDRRRTAK